MQLGKYFTAAVLLLNMISGPVANSQPVKSRSILLDRNPQKFAASFDKQSINISFSLPEIDIVSITGENGTFYKIDIPGYIQSTEPGKPQLPVSSRLIAIPDNGGYTIKISGVKTARVRPKRKDIDGILYPAQLEEPKKTQIQKPAFKIDKSLYATRGFIEKDTVTIEQIGKARGMNLATLQISPVLYNPKSNILEVITSMNIEITFSGSITSPAKGSVLFAETFSKSVLNYDPADLIPGYSDKPVRMIILTDTAFNDYLEPYIRWKTQKGFRVEVLFRGSDFAGNTYSEIKSTLSDIYNSSTPDNPAPEYLMIVGNTSKVPYYGTGQVTDMYYGEFDGDGDYIPEMFIGRLPVADTSQLRSVTEKIIQYERFEFADTNLFHSNAIATAGYDGGNAIYMNGQIRYASSNYLIPENNIQNHVFYYSQETNNSDSIKVRKDSIIKLINNGASFINYTGHGSESGWLGLGINNATVDTLNNTNMYPFIISNACLTSSYETTNSFGNRWVLSDKKGAIGFIGASNDTYWSEDVYWAVGIGNISEDPLYEETGLGAYDRLFHTHDEAPSDWYSTMSQIIYAGNLAVGSSTSSRKKYYWEVYNLVGDPSVIPITGTPKTFNIVLPDTLPNNIKTWSLSGEPFAYIAVTHADTLCDASHFSPSGNVTLNLPEIEEDSCHVVITGQNRIPLINTIKISTVSGEYVNLTAIAIDDSTENNNGMADFGESISVNLTVSNLGTADAENLYVKISSESEYITIISDSVMTGTLAADENIFLDDQLKISIASNVPDMQIIPISITLKDDREEKIYSYDIIAHAPDFEVVNFILDDTETGNANNIADQGETVSLIFTIRNKGTGITSGQFYLTSSDASISILDPPVKSDELGFGETTIIPVSVKLSESLESGAVIYFTAVFDYSPFLESRVFSLRVGQIRESFEYETFKVFPWMNISKVPWIITGSDSYDGIYSARSGEIGHNSSSVLSIKTHYTVEDSVKFWYNVSSELNYDFLIFKLNGTEIFRESGETGWKQHKISVPMGYNIMEWIYKKDQAVIGGSDCAKLDMIDFSEFGKVSFVRKDLAAAKLISPYQKDRMGMEKVTLKVMNEGPDTINGFNMAYRVNNDIAVKEHFENILIPFGDSVNISFTIPYNFSRYGIYDIEIYGYDNEDDYLLNDTLRTEIDHTTILEPFLVFPNPFTEELKVCINSDVASTAHFYLYSISGVKHMDFEYDIAKGMNEISLDARNLPPSLYYFRLEYPGISRTVKLIKTKM